MSRLYDRILAFGCKPTRFSKLYRESSMEVWRDRFEGMIRTHFEGKVPDTEIDRLANKGRVDVPDIWLGVAEEVLDPRELDGLPVVVAP